MPASIANLRRNLSWSQVEMARILGVHSMTISKWERGVSRPSSYHNDLLIAFRRAWVEDHSIGSSVKHRLIHDVPKVLGQMLMAWVRR